VRRLALVAAAALLAAGCDSDEQRPPERPNVVVIMTDDQRVDDLAAMPAVRRLIVRQGTSFANSFASFPLCCPSRATFLTGQYAHNHGVEDNRPPLGGYYALDGEETLPVWLQRAGYETAHIGKYLNGYGSRDPGEVPTGWDNWQGTVDPSTYLYWGYTLNDNGRLVRPPGYQTDELTSRAVRFLRGADEPFFLSLAYLAPHNDRTPPLPEFGALPGCLGSAKPAPRHSGLYAGRRMPTSPSFNEADMSDKPSFVRSLPRLGARDRIRIERDWRCRRESLAAVDEGVTRIVEELRDSRRLEHTLILFTSDNGFLLGEHRLPNNKINVYEEAVRVPLAIRGPGFPAGERVSDPVANIDLAPTIVDAAGAEPGLEMDGVSLLSGGPRRARPIVLENRARPFEARYAPYSAVRLGFIEYVEYVNGESELYDLSRDPHQLRARRGARPPEVVALLERLRDCQGSGCRRRGPE
jgi:N-acetylglucosamine-6-sulfatase